MNYCRDCFYRTDSHEVGVIHACKKYLDDVDGLPTNCRKTRPELCKGQDFKSINDREEEHA